MAQMPSIAGTAARRVLPSANYDVQGATPAAFGAGVGQAIAGLGEQVGDVDNAIQNFHRIKLAEENRLAEFDRQTQFVNFGAAQTEKLAEARRSLSGPAQGFTQGFTQGFDADAESFLSQVPERNRHEWQARMAQLRGQMSGAALGSEFAQRDAYYKTTIGDTLGKLQNGIMSSPDSYDAYLKQGDEIITSSGLAEQDKLENIKHWHAAAAMGAAQGDLQRDPIGAMQRLGGIDTKYSATPGTPGQYVSPTSAATGDVVNKIIGVESRNRPGAKNPNSTASGLGQFTDTTWLSLYKQKIGAGGKSDAQILALKTDGPLSRQMTGFLVEENKRVLAAKGLPQTDANVYALHFLGPTEGPQLIAAPAGQPVSEFLPQSFITANKTVLQGKTAGEVRDWAAKKMGGTAAPAATATTPFEQAFGTASAGQPGTVVQQTIGTGQVDPRYADLPLEARVSLISAAQRQVHQQEAQVAQAQQKAHGDWFNGLLNDLNEGKAGAADIENATKQGLLTDYDEIHKAQQILASKTKTDTDLSNFNAMLGDPNFAWNPYSDDQKKGVEAAVDAAVKTAGGPAAGGGLVAAQTAFTIWQRTGILAKAGGAALRGGLVSTDPQKIMASASIATNMLSRNPNAFAGVEGQGDIEKAAAAYTHYVNDLGYSGDEAAKKMAAAAQPEARRRFDADAPQREAFRKELVATDLTKTLGGNFATGSQRTAALQDYAELALEYYRGDQNPGAAQAYAKQQMSKLYGVANGRVMKFPPTKAYPPVFGSHDYIYGQAQADIQQFTGKRVDTKDIYLVPLPGRDAQSSPTAEAYRNGGKVPYQIFYSDRSSGQRVDYHIPGAAFTADPAAARVAETPQREAQFRYGAVQGLKPPTLAEVRSKNPQLPGENLFTYQQRLGSLQMRATEQLHATQRAAKPPAASANQDQISKWERSYPRNPGETDAAYAARNPYRPK